VPASFARVNAEAVPLGSFSQAALELGEAGKEASPTTWSHSRIASWSLGSRLMTGPKNAVPSGGPKWMIGVPTSLPVSASASSVSARSSPSQLASSRASASAAGNPARLSRGSTNSRLPCSSGPSADAAAESNAWGADHLVQGPDRLAAVLGAGPGGPAAAAARRCGQPRSLPGSACRSRRRR
jgi:hypothetical protein